MSFLGRKINNYTTDRGRVKSVFTTKNQTPSERLTQPLGAEWWWLGRDSRSHWSSTRSKATTDTEKLILSVGFQGRHRGANELFKCSSHGRLGGSPTMRTVRSTATLFSTVIAMASGCGQTNMFAIPCQNFYQVSIWGRHVFILNIFIKYLWNNKYVWNNVNIN